MDQESLENVLTTPQVHASHLAGLIAMSEGPFQHQSSKAQQAFATFASNPPPVRVNSITFRMLVDPVSSFSMRLRCGSCKERAGSGWNRVDDPRPLRHSPSL